jgi:hypothetical protein
VDETHSCPRRAEAPYRLPGDDGVDRWEDRGGLGGQVSAGPSCTYCGSLEPDRFMELAEQGWWVDPTDKAYKAYVAEPLTDEQVAEQRAEWMAGPFVARVRDAVCEDHADNVNAAVEKEWQQMPAARGHGQVVAKFYYQHLSVAQQLRFIELVNTRTMKIGLPGYFYARPFFIQPAGAAG